MAIQRRAPTSPAAWILAAVFFVLAALAILWVLDAIQGDDDVPDIGVTLEEVDADPGAYVGHLVVVSGVIDELVSSRVFTLGDEAFPVVADTDQVVTASVVAQVTGTVERTTADELAADLGGDAVALELFEDDQVYVLRAENIVLNPFNGRATEDTGALPDPVIEARGVLSLDFVQEHADILVGERVTIGGDISRQIGDHLTVMNGRLYETEDLLVVSPGRAPGVFPLTVPARVTGILGPFDEAAIERDLGIEIDDEVAEEWNGRLALAMESVRFFVSGPLLPTLTSDLLGWPVAVTGEVERTAGPSVLVLAEGDIVVFTREPVASDVPPGALAQVAGIASVVDAQTLAAAGFADAWAALSEDERAELEGRPALLADELRIAR